MIDTERKKLFSGELHYISLGIASDGEPCDIINVPWEATSHAFNMKLPNLYITPDDLYDTEIISRIKDSEVIGCYVYAPLSDYSLISQFSHVRDLNIFSAGNMKRLDFLLPLTECSMLYLEGARLESLDVLLSIKEKHRSIFGVYTCVCLYDCEVQDLSGFEGAKTHFSEFIVWMPKGKNERKRWGIVPSEKLRYYEF